MALFSGKRLREKLTAQGLGPTEIEARVKVRLEKLAVARSIGPAVVRAVVSGVPMAGAAARVLGSIPGVKALPVVREVAAEAVRVSTGVPLGRSLAADLVPMWHDIKVGNYKAAAFAGTAFLITSGLLTWAAVRFNVTLPAWLLPTILDLLNEAPVEAARLLIGGGVFAG